LTVFLFNFNEIQLTLRILKYHNNLEISYRDMENLIAPNSMGEFDYFSSVL